MASGPKYIVKYRRIRKTKTNYKRRLNLLKSGKPRLVVRKTSKHMIVQVIAYKEDGDTVVACAHSQELVKLGWTHATSNIPAAYLVGLLLGKRAKSAGVSDVIVDLGMASLVKGGRIYAVLKGVIDGGLSFLVGEGVFPSDERVRGEHIKAYNKKSEGIISDFNKLKDSLLRE